MLASDILDEAANRIEKYGWFRTVQNTIHSYPKNKDKNAHATHECAFVAITRAEGGGRLILDVEQKLVNHIDPKFHSSVDDFYTITKWNDAQPNAANVIRKLRSVAKKLRAKGE